MSFRKRRPDAPAGFFEAEAAGLQWLAAAEGAAVVEVHGVGPGWIELAELSAARPTAAGATAFGAALARTHAAGAPAWGAPPDGYTGETFIGRQPMRCEPGPTFGIFFAEQRVLPYLRVARDRGHVDDRVVATVERACDRLSAGDFDDDTPPARIHGDLWNGNVFWTGAGAVLIDPAAHGGHPETDLAMLALFGIPFLDRILEGYAAGGFLTPGWRARVPLHQLHPLAVHAASHGPAYAAELRAAAEATLTL